MKSKVFWLYCFQLYYGWVGIWILYTRLYELKLITQTNTSCFPQVPYVSTDAQSSPNLVWWEE